MATLELGLRLAGFEFTGIPTHVQFGPNVEDGLARNVLEEDPLLFWRARWGADTQAFLEGCGALRRGQAGRTAAGNPVSAEPLVVALGDSCTLFGSPPYSQRLEQLLRGRLPRAQVVNAGVPGYSSLQGRRWFNDEIAALQPDWVTVYFGWNDHWLSYQVPDDEVGARRLPGGSALGVLGRLRIVHAARAIGTRLNAPAAGRTPLRVPPEHYRVNLAAICQEAKEVGARVAFITAPSAITPAMARMLRERGYVADAEGLASLHETYNTASRDVAAQCGATLVDFAAAPDPASLLTADGIHLAPAGVEELAGRLAGVILGSREKATY